MFGQLFLAAALISVLGKSSVDGSSQKIWAFVGEDVMLPCLFSATPASNIHTVEWSKKGLESKVAYLYRDGFETCEMKHQDFHNRTSITLNKLKEGNASLIICNLTLSDSGNYTCMRHWDVYRIQDTVELLVDSEPKLSIILAENGGMTVVCEALCWWSEPEIQILNDQGTNVCDEVQRTDRDSSGRFTMSCSVPVTSNTNREMKCVIRQPVTNQTRTAKPYIPALCDDCSFRHEKGNQLKDGGQCVMANTIAIVATFALVIGSIVLLYKQYLKCAVAQPSHKSCSPKTSQPLLSHVDEDNNKNATIEEVSKENVELQAKLSGTARTIDQLNQTIDQQKQTIDQQKQTINQVTQERDTLKAKQSPTCQLQQPTISLYRSSSTIEPTQDRESGSTRELKSLSRNTHPPRSDLPQSNHPKLSVHSCDVAHESNHQHQRRKRINSCPAFSEWHTSPLPTGKKPSQIPRTMSFSSSQHGSAARHPLISPKSVLHNNPYGLLADLNEE